MQRVSRWITLLLLATALIACGGQQTAAPTPTGALQAPTSAPTIAPTAAPTAEPTAAPTVAAPSAPAANLTEGCVTDYDPEIDYFPEKVTLSDSAGWTIEYFNNYKVITVLNPWRDADVQFRYVLVQCGTPPPADTGDALVIEVPVNRIVAMSTTQLPHLSELGVLDTLVGVDSFLYINNPDVRKKIEAGELVEIGSGGQVNVEQALDLQPDLIMTYGVGNPEYDAHPKLLEANLKVVLNSEYMETSPLGRAEWIKFTAAFFNREAQATEGLQHDCRAATRRWPRKRATLQPDRRCSAMRRSRERGSCQGAEATSPNCWLTPAPTTSGRMTPQPGASR
jgi:iron complex transport system substrate-binding protein